MEQAQYTLTSRGWGEVGIGCARDRGASNGINGMPRNRTTLQRYSEMKFAWKYLAHVLHSGSEWEAKVGNCRADIFFQCRYFAPMSPLGAHTYLSWWRQPNSQIQIPINCTEKKTKSSKQQVCLLQAFHVEAIQPSDKVKLLELPVKMKFAQDHCYDLARS